MAERRLIGPVLYRFRAELRSRRRTWLSVAVLAGVFYGAVIAALAGAQRTDTVVARSIRHKLAPDVFMVPVFSIHPDLLNYDAISRFPEVREAIRIDNFLTPDWDLYAWP